MDIARNCITKHLSLIYKFNFKQIKQSSMSSVNIAFPK